MALEPRDKELVAIGASIGALCRPCIDHHIAAGRDAGLTQAELARAVDVAQGIHASAQGLLFRHSRALLFADETSRDAPVQAPRMPLADELIALGASIGANCHPLLERYVAGVLERGMSRNQVRSAIKMAEFVQAHAAGVTAEKAAAAIGVERPTDNTVLASAAKHPRR